MKPALALRIAAVLLAIHLLGHGVGHFTWDKPEDPGMADVVATMKNYNAKFMGATKSMADYYNGYSLMMFGVFGMSIFILWISSNFIYTNERFAAKILLPIGITYLLFGIIEYISFFPFAAGLSFLSGLLILFSLYGKHEKQ